MDPRGARRVVRSAAALYAAGVLVTHASVLAGRPSSAYVALLSEEPLWLTGLWLAAVACLVAGGRPPVPAGGALAFGLGPLLVESYLLYRAVSLSGTAAGAVHPAVGGAVPVAALRFAAALAVVAGALAALYRGAAGPDRDSRVSTP